MKSIFDSLKDSLSANGDKFDENHSVDSNSLSSFIHHINESRIAIINRLATEYQYIVNPNLKICEIGSHLVYFSDSLVICKTINL